MKFYWRLSILLLILNSNILPYFIITTNVLRGNRVAMDFRVWVEIRACAGNQELRETGVWRVWLAPPETG